MAYLCERKKMVQKKPIPGFKEILNQTDLHQGTRTQTLEPYVTGIHDSLGFSIPRRHGFQDSRY